MPKRFVRNVLCKSTYCTVARKLATELVNRRESINRELSRNGVRFGIYKDGEYHDRLFPYDPIPRIIESNEFDEMEAGLKQRVNALNAYLRDVYSDKKVIKDGIIPEEYVYTSAGYFPQVNGVPPRAACSRISQVRIWCKDRTANGGCWKTICAFLRVSAIRCSRAILNAGSRRDYSVTCMCETTAITVTACSTSVFSPVAMCNSISW